MEAVACLSSMGLFQESPPAEKNYAWIWGEAVGIKRGKMGGQRVFFHPRTTMSYHYILGFPFHIVFRDRLVFHDMVRKCL